MTLQSYIEHQHEPSEGRSVTATATPRGEGGGCPQRGHHARVPGRFLYAKLLLLLTELQTLKAENTRQILHIQDLSAMTPLLSEIIS